MALIFCKTANSYYQHAAAPSSSRRQGNQARGGQRQRPSPKEHKMRKLSTALSLAAALTVAVLLSSCASQNAAGSNLTVRCTDTITRADVTNGGVAAHGHCTLTGVLHDNGPEIDYRTQTPEVITIRRVITGAKGTITLVVKIPQIGAGGEPFTITSGTGAYAKLHGHGLQVVDNYQATPATFVLKGTATQTQT